MFNALLTLVKLRLRRWIKFYLFFAVPVILLIFLVSLNLLTVEHASIAEMIMSVLLFFISLPIVIVFQDGIFNQSSYTNQTKLLILLLIVAVNMLFLLTLSSFFKIIKKPTKPKG